MAVKDIRPAFAAYLYGDATIRATVGGGLTKEDGGRRIDPVKLRQGVTAASLVYNLVSEAGDVHNEGPDGLCSARMQVDAYATTADAAMALALQVKQRLHGARGTFGVGGAAVEVQGVFLGGSVRTEYDETARLHRVGRDFVVWFWDQ